MKRFMRKILTFILFLLLSFALFSACSKDFTSQKCTSLNKTTIKFSGWTTIKDSEKEFIQDLIAKFSKSNKCVNVEYSTHVSKDPINFQDSIQRNILGLGEQGPDVFYLDVNLASDLISSELLEPLNSRLQQETSDFYDKLIEAFQYEEKVYGIPKDYSTLALYYNKKIFKEKGLREPPKTWEQLKEYSKKLTVVGKENDGKIERYGLGFVHELSHQLFMLKAYGGGMSNQSGNATFASPESLKGLEQVFEPYYDKSFGIFSDVIDDKTSISSIADMFLKEKAAMIIEGMWILPDLQNELKKLGKDFENVVGIAELPKLANGKQSTMLFTVAYAMNRQSQNKQDAWNLIAYLTGKQGMEEWVNKQIALPSRQSIADQLIKKHPNLKPFVAGMKYATPWKGGKNLRIVDQSFNTQFKAALKAARSDKGQTLKDARNSLEGKMRQAQLDANKQIEEIGF